MSEIKCKCGVVLFQCNGVIHNIRTGDSIYRCPKCFEVLKEEKE